MDCLEALMTRRSIRRYTDDPVSESDIDVLLRAAMAAPSAGNQQSWRIIVVTDREQLDRLSRATPYSSMLAQAPVGFVVCGNTEGLRHPRYWAQDCSAAIENLLVAANAIGLGGVWIGCYPIEEQVANVREICGVPEGIVPMSMIALGHPAESKPPGERYEPKYVHHDRWGA